MRLTKPSPSGVGSALVGLALVFGFGTIGETGAVSRGGPPGTRVDLVEADATGFSVSFALAEPTFERVDTSAGPCWRITLPTVEGSAGSPVSGQTAYGWMVGLPGPGGGSILVRGVVEDTRRVGALCGRESDETTPARRVVVGQHLGETVPNEGGLTLGLRAWADEVTLPGPDAPPVLLEEAGYLRQQPVARLVVRPVARAAEDAVIVRSKLLVRVDYSDPETVAQAAPADGPFDILDSVLLNKVFLPRRQLRAWVSGPDGSAGGAACARSAPALVGRLFSTSDHAPLPSVAAGEERPASDPQSDPPSQAPRDAMALKLLIERDGPVAVSGASLAEHGWDLTAVDPTAVTLESGGRPVAIALAGAEDGRIDPGDRLTFQGRAMTGLYTRENVYWLRQAGEPLRYGERDGPPRDGVAAAVSFTETLHFERDSVYAYSIDPSGGDDSWMWGRQIDAGTDREETVVVRNLAPHSARGRLRVGLQGYTDDRNVSPDHHVRLELNDRVVLDTRFDGLGVQVLRADVDPGLLVEGANRVTIRSVGDSGAVVDTLFLNWIEIDYSAGYRASDGRLDFEAPAVGLFAFRLVGFTAPEVTVLDVTDPSQPVRIARVLVEESGDGKFDVRFSDTASEMTRYTAFTPSAAAGPARVVPNAPSDLRAPGRGADYIVITHPGFVEALEPLVDLRAAEGLRVSTVLIDDVYDEFSHGVFDPRAIKSFLRYAFEHWARPAPTYVLLVGESNLDYRRGYDAGPQNYVPSVQLDASGGGLQSHYTSDLWFAALRDDVLPDVLLGRISVSTVAQAQAVVDKILRYEVQPSEAEWRRRAVLVADDDGAPDFEALSERLASVMPPGTDVRRFYAAEYPRDKDLSGDIRDAIDEGAFALNFVGHGNVTLWSPWPGGGRIFETDDIRQLANGDSMPIFTAATCMNGWIDHPLKPVSMTEAWLTHPSGGGVVAWAASGFASVSAEGALIEPFYRGLYDGRGLPVGALTAEASMQAYARGRGWADTVRMFILLGDPALVVSGVPPLATRSPTAKAPTSAPTSDATCTTTVTSVPTAVLRRTATSQGPTVTARVPPAMRPVTPTHSPVPRPPSPVFLPSCAVHGDR